jgi:hypothetical protein
MDLKNVNDQLIRRYMDRLEQSLRDLPRSRRE